MFLSGWVLCPPSILIDNGAYYQTLVESMSEKLKDLPTELKTHSVAVTLPHSQLSLPFKSITLTGHSSDSGLNALVDCSAAAFEHIHVLTQSSLSSENKQNLTQFLENLQKHYQHLGYTQDTSLAAHYAICATLDDIMRHHAKHPLHSTTHHSEPAQFLQSFHQSQLEQEKFYSILEHISSQPEKYIDLLELMYLCLRFGYKGQYRNTPFGLQKWSLLTDSTYRLIRETRGSHSQTLSPSQPNIASANMLLSHDLHSSKPLKKSHRFYLLVALLFIVLAVAAGFVFKQTYNATRATFVSHSLTESPLKSSTI